ncbi:MAG TPA: histidine triad nucleotide-binding protein [Burkholderiales bacterium]|nr:histidine triad nucleotide-binding protein [Burkholderiales bacterium]
MSDTTTPENCVFCRIVRGEISAKKAYEDELVLAFHDIHPVAPVHVLLIPKAHVASLAECGPDHQAVLGRMLAIAPRLARELGATDGFRTLINTGRDGRQEVYHLHMHVIGGRDTGPMIVRI